MDNKLSIDYEKEYERAIKKIAELKEKNNRQLQENTKFYERILTQKDEELKWYKKVINGILHI